MEIIKSDNSTKGAIIYLRVSTEEQVDNFSLETQEKICRQEAERRNMEVIQIFKEEVTIVFAIQSLPVYRLKARTVRVVSYARWHDPKLPLRFSKASA